MPWLLLILPLLSATAIHLGLKKNAHLSALIATGSALATLLLTIILLFQEKPEACVLHWASFGDFHLNIGLLLDSMARKMMLVVTGVGSLVHIFSLVYMADDKAKARYFCGLSLFMFSMTGIVLADNFIMTFIFWELVGLSSYLLIGHWYTKASAADAAKKAFCVNRIGDFGFMVGILMFWILAGTLTFEDMKLSSEASTGIMGAALLCVFCGAVGKSAQAPLHVWLPDAMEGPTPVSALIHAATMVAAGVYMMARVFLSIEFDFAAFPKWSTNTIAYLGGFTSLIAALMATQQSDIKKILAYSTLSQLGYMVLVLGIAHGHSTDTAMFHLYTHAWFKALLFLGSGAIIYACHHEQDIWQMGGLAKKMPLTTLTFLIGTLALAGFPFTAGFFSKEQILHETLHENFSLFILVVVVAILTTFYMGRLFFVVFLGNPRSKHAEEAKEVGPLMWVPLAILATFAVISGFPPVAKAISPLFHHVPLKFGTPLFASIGAFAVGAALAYLFYFKKDRDILANNPLSKCFANSFYVDKGYSLLVKYAVNVKAAVIEFIDEFIIGGLIVGGLARCTSALGQFFNRTQSGSIQTYTLLMGVGILLIIYLTVFVK